MRRDDPTGPLLIDVRSHGEFAAGHLRGALCLPLDCIAQQIGQHCSDPQRPLLLYCASGMRSEMARRQLEALGYARVSNGGGAATLAMQLGLPIDRL